VAERKISVRLRIPSVSMITDIPRTWGSPVMKSVDSSGHTYTDRASLFIEIGWLQS